MKSAMTQIGGLLPNSYQKVEYIESTGSQYIDTDYIPNQSTRVVVDFESTGSGLRALFGARYDTHTNIFGIWIDERSIYPTFDNNLYRDNTVYICPRQRLIYDMNRNKFIVSDRTVELDCSKEFDSGCPLTILTFNTKNNKDSRRAIGRLYSFLIWNNDILVRNLIPCYRKSDNEIGMYDLVDGVFYTNQGTDVFLKGADI